MSVRRDFVTLEQGANQRAVEEGKMVRPERFELPTLWFVAKCSIQLSYGRARSTVYQRGLTHVMRTPNFRSRLTANRTRLLTIAVSYFSGDATNPETAPFATAW